MPMGDLMHQRTPSVLSALAVMGVLAAGFLVAGRQPAAAPQPVAAAPSASWAMPEYPSLTALRKVEPSENYAVSTTITGSPLIVVAPHGGGIEVRTSEIVKSIALTDHSQCHFKGLLPAGNHPRLHVTSEHWDLEECLILIRQRPHALSIHGFKDDQNRLVYVGGRDTVTGAKVTAALTAAGFKVEAAPGHLAGTSPDNFVNKDADGMGVQLELSSVLRKELVTTDGQPSKCTAALPQCGESFAQAIRSVYPTTSGW